MKPKDITKKIQALPVLRPSGLKTHKADTGFVWVVVSQRTWGRSLSLDEAWKNAEKPVESIAWLVHAATRVSNFGSFHISHEDCPIRCLEMTDEAKDEYLFRPSFRIMKSGGGKKLGEWKAV